MKNVCLCIMLLFGLNCLASNKDSADFYLQKAILEKSHPHIAIKFLDKALVFDQDNIPVMTEYVSVTMELRKYELSKDVLEKLYKIDSKNNQTIDNLAHVYFYLRKFDEAIVFGKKMIENGIGTDADFIVGKSEYENENYQDAVRFLESYYKRDNKKADVPYTIGRCYIELSQYKKAAAYYENAIALDTNNAYRIYEMGLVYYAIPDDRTAIACFERAAAKGYKKDNGYYENLGNAYINLGQADKGIECYNIVLQRKPNDTELLYAVADAYYKSNRYNEAIDYWNRILANDGKHARSLYMVGMSFQKKGEKDKGQAICDKAIQLDPSLANNKRQVNMTTGL